MPENNDMILLLGEIKGRLDTYVAAGEAERAHLRRLSENHEERIVSLETHMASTKTLGGLFRWLALIISGVVGATANHFLGVNK